MFWNVRDVIGALLVVSVTSSTAVAWAQDGSGGTAGAGPARLRSAESAYSSVDYEAAAFEATRALESGGLGAAQLARVYELTGIARAIMGQRAEARDAFVALLALDANADVLTVLAPRFRAPYLEALEIARSRSGRLDASVSINDGELEVSYEDPFSLATFIRIWIRQTSLGWVSHELPAQVDQYRLSLGEYDRSEELFYRLESIDQYHNQVFVLGSRAQPRVLASLRDPTEVVTEDDSTLWESPWIWAALGAVVAGLVVGSILFLSGSSTEGRTTVSYGTR